MTNRTNSPRDTTFKELTDIEIVQTLPSGQFNETVLRKAIQARGIASRQSIDEHANAIIRYYLDVGAPGRFSVRADAMKSGKIVINVMPKTLRARVLKRTKNALKDVAYITIEEV